MLSAPGSQQSRSAPTSLPLPAPSLSFMRGLPALMVILGQLEGHQAGREGSKDSGANRGLHHQDTLAGIQPHRALTGSAWASLMAKAWLLPPSSQG